MKAVFIRHKQFATSEILQDLWNRREIALHYADIRSTNPDDYEHAGKVALLRLHGYCQAGAIVAASYRQVVPGIILVGIIPPGSQISWTDRYGESFIYKVVQLQNVKEVSLIDYPILGAIQPIKGAISGWPSAQAILNSIVNDLPIEPAVHNLSPAQLEVICYEYLQMKAILNALLMPIGRNLLDIDIVGMGDEGRKIFAQVSFTMEQVGRKLQLLREYKSTATDLYYFGPRSQEISEPDIRFIPIETVFEALQNSDNVIYRQLINCLFNR